MELVDSSDTHVGVLLTMDEARVIQQVFGHFLHSKCIPEISDTDSSNPYYVLEPFKGYVNLLFKLAGTYTRKDGIIYAIFMSQSAK